VFPEEIQWEKTLASTRETWQRSALSPTAAGRHGVQFTHHKTMPILLLLWVRLYKEQRNKSPFSSYSIICQEALPSCQPCFSFKLTAL